MEEINFVTKCVLYVHEEWERVEDFLKAIFSQIISPETVSGVFKRVVSSKLAPFLNILDKKNVR